MKYVLKWFQGQGHLQENVPGRFKDMSWSCPIFSKSHQDKTGHCPLKSLSLPPLSMPTMFDAIIDNSVTYKHYFSLQLTTCGHQCHCPLPMPSTFDGTVNNTDVHSFHSCCLSSRASLQCSTATMSTAILTITFPPTVTVIVFTAPLNPTNHQQCCFQLLPCITINTTINITNHIHWPSSRRVLVIVADTTTINVTEFNAT